MRIIRISANLLPSSLPGGPGAGQIYLRYSLPGTFFPVQGLRPRSRSLERASARICAGLDIKPREELALVATSGSANVRLAMTSERAHRP